MSAQFRRLSAANSSVSQLEIGGGDIADAIATIDSIRLLLNEPPRAWRKAVVQQLEELCALERGWDGYGGRPVSFETANFALRMLEVACATEVLAPQIVPGSDGDLQIEWHTAHGDIELDVRAPNDVRAWRHTAATPAEGEEIALRTDFKVIAQWIREMVEQPGAAGAAAA